MNSFKFKLNRCWLFLLFPLLYGIPVLIINYLDNHDAKAALGYLGYFVCFPSSFVFSSLNIEMDAYNHIPVLISGTIQWGFVLYIVSIWISNSWD